MLAHISKKKENEQNQATGISHMSVLVVKILCCHLAKEIKKVFALDVVEQLN